MPVVLQLDLLALPELEEDARPDGHEAGKEHSRPVVEHVRQSGDRTAVSQAPVRTGTVALRAHDQVAGAELIAHLMVTEHVTVVVTNRNVVRLDLYCKQDILSDAPSLVLWLQSHAGEHHGLKGIVTVVLCVAASSKHLHWCLCSLVIKQLRQLCDNCCDRCFQKTFPIKTTQLQPALNART